MVGACSLQETDSPNNNAVEQTTRVQKKTKCQRKRKRKKPTVMGSTEIFADFMYMARYLCLLLYCIDHSTGG